jgi:hypothetical protein
VIPYFEYLLIRQLVEREAFPHASPQIGEANAKVLEARPAILLYGLPVSRIAYRFQRVNDFAMILL